MQKFSCFPYVFTGLGNIELKEWKLSSVIAAERSEAVTRKSVNRTTEAHQKAIS
jgi:hypothetical protein